MRPKPSRVVFAFVGCLVLGCASSSSSPAPPVTSAADCSNVPRNLATTGRTELRNDGNGTTLYVMNHTDCPIRITALVLRECQGIRGGCDTSIRRRVEIAPGEEKMVHVVRYTGNTGSSFRWTYSWQYIRD
jgi:hypothetical protein